MKANSIIRAKSHLDRLNSLKEIHKTLTTATGTAKWHDISVIHASPFGENRTDSTYLSSIVNTLGIKHEDVAPYLLSGLKTECEKKIDEIHNALIDLGVEVN